MGREEGKRRWIRKEGGRWRRKEEDANEGEKSEEDEETQD